jgi:glycerophosphoryl diester phosphodiesterase
MKRDSLRWLTARPIAHRGYHDRARGRPENSLAAFSAAIASHYSIECDLHLSADNVPVVFHDNDLSRLIGRPESVRDLAASELGDLRILGTPEWIPTLDELLLLVEGRVPLVLELKHMPGRDGGFAWEVVERLKRYAGPAALMSFDAALIADIRAADPGLPRGLVATGDWRSGATHMQVAMQFGVNFISYSIDYLPTPMPILARRALGIPLICWTVRTPVELKRAQMWTDQITFEGFAA